MNAPILKKTRLWTLAAAVAISLGLSARIGTNFETDFVLGFLGSAVWTVAGLWFVEMLVRHAMLPPSQERNRLAIGLLLLGKMALYGVALWVLMEELVPPVSCVFGFSLLLIVLVIAAVAVKPSLRVATDSGPKDGPGERENDD